MTNVVIHRSSILHMENTEDWEWVGMAKWDGPFRWYLSKKKWGICHYAKPTDRSQITSRNTWGKWNDMFWLNRANQKEWLLSIFSPFLNSLIRAKNRFVKIWSEYSTHSLTLFYFSRSPEISGPPPDVIPNIPIKRNRNSPFEFQPKLLKSLTNGKHPWPASKGERILSKLI